MAFPRPDDGLGAASATGTANVDEPLILSQIPLGEQSGVMTDNIKLTIHEHLHLHSGYEPHIELKRTVCMAASSSVIRDARAEFWLEGKTLQEGGTRSVASVEIVDLAKDDAPTVKYVKIVYSNALVAGADNLDFTWPTFLVEFLDELTRIRTHNVVFIPLRHSHQEYLDTLSSKIEDYINHEAGKTLRPFHTSTLALVQATKGKGRSTARQCKPISDWWSMDKLHADGMLEFPKSTAVNTFSDLFTAEIKLTNGRYLDHMWEETLLNRLSGGIEAAFVLLDQKVILAFVRYKTPLGPDLTNALSDRTRIEISASDPSYISDDEEEGIVGSGTIVANRMGVKADFLVMIKKRSKALFKTAKPLTGELRWLNATIKIVQDRSLAKKEIDGVRAICGSDSPHSRFHHAFLAQGLAEGKQEHWLRDLVGCDPSTIDKSISTVLKKMEGVGRELNTEQESILRNVQYSWHSTDVIRGPPGCGKTTLMAAMAEVIVRCANDVAIFMCAPSNGNTQRIWETVNEFTRAAPSIVTEADSYLRAPQRVYRVHLEEEYLIKCHDTLGQKIEDEEDAQHVDHFAADFEKLTADAEWYSRVADADTKREINDPKTGLTAAVLDLIEQRPMLQVVGRLGKHEQPQNVVPVLKHGIDKLKQLPFKKWAPRGQKKFKAAWLLLAQRLVGKRHIVCCTVGNITSRLMAEALAHFKYGVIMIDEASLMTDPALCNALANVISRERIDSEYNKVSPIVKLIIIGDEAQGYPLVKTEHESANYFGEQLARSPYERLVLAGANVQEMWEQYRMVPTLCHMPNQRWYGGRLRVSQERQLARLDPKQKALLVQHFELDLNKIVVPDSQDREQAEDGHVRMLLANVPDGECQIEPQTQSRLNMANVEIIIHIFKELVSLTHVEHYVSAENELVVSQGRRRRCQITEGHRHSHLLQRTTSAAPQCAP